MSKKKKIGVVVGVLAVGMIAVIGIAKPNSTSSEQNIAGPKGGKMVQVAKVTKQDIESKVSASGALIADESEKIYAEVSNQVLEVVKEVGDDVKKGDVLLKLDPEVKEKMLKEVEKLNLQLENAKISLNQLQDTASKTEILQAQSNVIKADKGIEDLEEAIRATKVSIELTQKDVETASKMYDVTKELFNEGLNSQKELDDAKSTLNKAEESMNSLTNKVASLEQDLESAMKQKESADYTLSVATNEISDKTKVTNIAMKQNEIKSLELQKENLLKELDKSAYTLTSPIDGVVAELLVQEGAFISPGTPLMTVINPNQLSAQSEISPFYASKLATGLDATIKYNGSEVIEVPAVVSMVAPSGVVSTSGGSSATMIPIKLKLLEEVVGLKPGLVVDVKVITQKESGVIAVPLLATMKDEEGKSYVLIVKEDYTIEKRYITEGASDSFYIQIEGVNEGELVVTNPTDALVEGLTVNYKAFEEIGEVND